MRPEALATLREVMLPLATVLTPNLGEVRLLTGRAVASLQDMREAARQLYDLGPRWVLVKGGHLAGADAIDVLFDGQHFTEYRGVRHDTMHTHGSGDTLAAAIAAALATGAEVPDAVAQGKDFITRAVAGAFPLGAGLGPVGHFWRVGEWPAAADGPDVEA